MREMGRFVDGKVRSEDGAGMDMGPLMGVKTGLKMKEMVPFSAVKVVWDKEQDGEEMEAIQIAPSTC